MSYFSVLDTYKPNRYKELKNLVCLKRVIMHQGNSSQFVFIYAKTKNQSQ